MTAYRLVGWGQPPEFVEVAVPRPGVGEVVLKMAGVGLCHTDLHFLDAPPGLFPYELPFTLGHENAGWVEEIGPEVRGLAPGDAVVVAGIHSCGRCAYCVRGHDNYCPRGASGRGYGEDGGLAHYLVVPERELVRLSSLDPRQAAPLTDAGVTSYHAVRKALPKLRPGSTAVVIGAGGLGSYAVQHLRLLSPARVIAVDVEQHRLEAAREVGAHEAVAAGEGAAATIRAATDEQGAEAVFDFVGTDETIALATACARTMGTLALVGAGGGRVPVGWGTVPLECEVFVPMGATIAELRDVVALAEAGKLRIAVELFPFERAGDAYEAFRSGALRNRAVVVPNG